MLTIDVATSAAVEITAQALLCEGWWCAGDGAGGLVGASDVA